MSTTIEHATEYLIQVGSATFGQLFSLMGPGLILVVMLSWIAGIVEKLAYRAMGSGAYLTLFGWLGTTIHETGHVIFSLLFGQKVVEFKPFSPDPATNSLGRVRTLPNQNSLLQQIGNFFIGIGPVLFGTLVIYVASLILLVPDTPDIIRSADLTAASTDISRTLTDDIMPAAAAMIAFLLRPAHFIDWKFYVFVYIAFAVGSSIALSQPDIVGAFSGFVILVIFLFLFNLATLWLGDSISGVFRGISQLYVFFYAIMIFVIILNLIAAVILLPFAVVKMPKGNR
jgi:hypothetical protein